MEDHTRALFQRFRYSEHFKETAVFRIVFRGESPSHMVPDQDVSHQLHATQLGEPLPA